MTLLELVIVVAIIALLAAGSYATVEGMGARSGPTRASNDLTSALSEARARAVARTEDVWVIIYPDIDPEGTSGTGSGAWFMLEDRQMNFGSAAAVPGELRFSSFLPPNAIQPAASQGRLIEANYLDKYTRRSVRFGVAGGIAFDGIFAALPASPCSFCSGTPRRGAIIFRPDGSARFVDGMGAAVVPIGAGAAGRAAALGIVAADSSSEFLFAISGPVGFIETRFR
ncbi:prepilin-type cleavage/methylation domain-containing protein [Corallococcus sp. H22C18031201]|nr:prepilin-type N-terminal cleavage/methylation domain-containing protein [Citreicoccus inhibens]RJS16130.1 prepilin-type cleavage/methylation domain-containing protein [Corallococcus sp. H22C18031201]